MGNLAPSESGVERNLNDVLPNADLRPSNPLDVSPVYQAASSLNSAPYLQIATTLNIETERMEAHSERVKTIDLGSENSTQISRLSALDYWQNITGDNVFHRRGGKDSFHHGLSYHATTDRVLIDSIFNEYELDKLPTTGRNEDIPTGIEEIRLSDKVTLLLDLESPLDTKNFADTVVHSYSQDSHNYGSITRLDNGSIVSTWNSSASWDVHLRIKKFGQRNYEDISLGPFLFKKEGNIGHFSPEVIPFSNHTFLWSWTASNIPDSDGVDGIPAVQIAEYSDSGEFVRSILNLTHEGEVGRVAVGLNADDILIVSYMIKNPGSDKVEYIIVDASEDVPAILSEKAQLPQSTGGITDPVVAKTDDGFLLITAEKLYSIGPKNNYIANELMSFDLPGICNFLVPVGENQFVAGFGGHDGNIFLKKLDLDSEKIITHEVTLNVIARGEFDADVIDDQLLLTWAQHIDDGSDENGIRGQFFDFDLNPASEDFSLYEDPNSNLDQELEIDTVVSDLGLSIKFNTEFRSADGAARNNILDVIDLVNREITVAREQADFYVVNDQNFWDLWANGDVIDLKTGSDHLHLSSEAPITSLPDAADTTKGVGLQYFVFDLANGTIDANPEPIGTTMLTEGTYPVEGTNINAPSFLNFEKFSYYGDADARIFDTPADNLLVTGAGEDVIYSKGGQDLILSHERGDEIVLSSQNFYASNMFAYNVSSDWQVGTGERISVSGKAQFETVVNGGEGYDTVTLTEKSDAYFLHDNYSSFNSDIILAEDFSGKYGFNRVSLIEEINAGAGDDVIDLTSPDYSMSGQKLIVNAGGGQDVLWGSDADETLNGGNGDDKLFGGAGQNVLIGGHGADEFQFTMTSTNDTIADFSVSDGDTLRFYNTGNFKFDRDSISLNSAGDKFTISYGSDIGDVVTISLTGASLKLDDLNQDVLFII